MIVSTDGIVLRSTKYSDTSLIVKIFTEKRGVQSFIVKGAFSKKSKFRASLFSPLAIVNITYDDRNREQLKYLKDLTRSESETISAFDPARSAILMFYNEILYKLLFDSSEDEVLFNFIREEIQRLSEPFIPLQDLPLCFLLRLSVILGFFPENNYSEKDCHFSLSEGRFHSYYIDENDDLPQEESHYLSQLLQQDETVVVPRHTRNNLLHYLLQYYKQHNEQIREIESAAILSSVLH